MDKDIFCNFPNSTPFKEQRKCEEFEQGADDLDNEFECNHCLIRDSKMYCEKKMTTKELYYVERI